MSKHDIKFPIRYDKESGFFFDDKNNMIAEIRGWGRIQYLDNPEETQDANAQFIVTACNYHERMKEVIRMVATRTAKVLPDGTPIFSARMASQMAKDILKELEEQK